MVNFKIKLHLHHSPDGGQNDFSEEPGGETLLVGLLEDGVEGGDAPPGRHPEPSSRTPNFL